MTEDEMAGWCSGGLRPLVELCVEPAGLCGRCTGVAVPLRVVPSSLFTFMHWRRKWQPTPVFLPGESLGQGKLSIGSRRVKLD